MRPADGGRRRVWRAGRPRVLAVAVAFVVVAPPERCPTVTADELRRSARPPSIGSSATRSRTARGSTSTTPTRTRSRPSTTRFVTPGVTMGLYQAAGRGLARSAALRRPRHRVGARRAPRARRLGRADRGAGVHRARARSSSAGLTFAGRRPATPLRRRPAPARALPGRPDRAVGRGARRLRPDERRAGRGRVLQVLHRGGVLGPGAASPAVPGRGLGRGGGPHRRLPGDLARRGRGLLAADPRPLGRLRARPRPSSSPSAAGAPLSRRRGRLRAPPGGAVRQRDPVGQPAARAVGRGRAGPDDAPRRRVRGDRRGPHRLVARRAARPRLADLEDPIAERAACIAGRWRWARNPMPRMRRTPRGRSWSRARGSPTARPGWTTSSTRWPRCCERSRSSRRRRRSRATPTRATMRHRVGYGPSSCCWRSTRPGRRSASPRRPVAARRRRPRRRGRRDRRARRLRRRGGRGPAPGRARRQRALLPGRRRDRRRDRRAPPTCSGDRPARALAAGPARRAGPRRDPGRRPPRPRAARDRRGRRPGPPRERGRDGRRRRPAHRALVARWPPEAPAAGCSGGPAACWPPGSSPAG